MKVLMSDRVLARLWFVWLTWAGYHLSGEVHAHRWIWTGVWCALIALGWYAGWRLTRHLSAVPR